MIASHNGLTTAAQSNHSHGNPTLNLTNLSGTTASNSAGFTLSLSAAAPGGNIVLAGSNGALTNTSFQFGNLNGLSFYTSNGSIVGSYTDAGAGAGISAVRISAGTTNADISNFSFSNANNVSWGINGSTITASVNAGGAGATLSSYDPYGYGAESVAGAIGNASLYFSPYTPEYAFQHDRIIFPIQFSNASNSSNSCTMSLSVGIYSKNASSLSLIGSTSTSIAYTASGTAGNYSLAGGIRHLTIPWTSTQTQAEYYLGVWSRTSANAGGQTFNQMLVSQPNSSASGLWGVASAASFQNRLGQGAYSASVTTAMPSAVSISQINGNSSILQRPPIFYFASGTV